MMTLIVTVRMNIDAVLQARNALVHMNTGFIESRDLELRLNCKMLPKFVTTNDRNMTALL